MIFVGIDPGLKGAIAVIDDDSIEIFDIPTLTKKVGKTMKRYIDEEALDIIINRINMSNKFLLEQIHAMPGQGVVSMFSMGEGYGIIKGILTANKCKYTPVTPQKWKKEMMPGMSKEKAASCVRAQELFPEAELYTKRGRALDGRGDALLIAEYGRREYAKLH